MKTNKSLALCSVLVAVGLNTQGQNITVSTSSDTSWLGSPVFETGGTPQGGSGGSTQDNDNWGGNANGTAGYGALGEIFEVSQAGILGSAELSMAGSAATFNVELYDIGPAPGGYQSAPGSAPAITQLNTLGGEAFSSDSGGVVNGGADLLQTGDQITFGGTASMTLMTLTFGGADSDVQLQSGELYLLSLDPTANADNTWWQRGGVPVSTYNTGEGVNADGMEGMQDFEGKSSVRDFDTAITEVPEPAPLALSALGSLAGALVLRRRKI